MNNLLEETSKGIYLPDEAELGDIELQDINDDYIPEESRFIDEFYAQVSTVKQQIEDIKSNTEKLTQTMNQRFSVINNKQEDRELREKINEINEETNILMNHVRDSLKKMQQMNFEMQSKEKNGKSVELRIRENQLVVLTNEFMDAMKLYNQYQADYKQRNAEKIKRHLRIAYPKDTDEQIQERLERGDYQENFFAQQILNTKAAEYTTKAILLEAKETRQDLLKLETSMTELVGMIKDMYILLNMQQDLIDNIEKNAERSAAYIEQGLKYTREAKKYQKKSRVTNCCIIMVILLISATIVIIAVTVPVVLKIVGIF